MTFWTIPAFVVGLAALVIGAEGLVRGASAIALRFGLSPVVVGLTVVAFGTSAPELAVSTGSALNDEAGLALGNVVGSNISNILLILGASAVIGTLTVHQRIVRIDVPIMIGVSVVTLLLALDGSIGRLDGVLLFAGVVVYVTWTVRQARADHAAERSAEDAASSRAVEDEYEAAVDGEDVTAHSPGRDLAFLVGGLVLLVIGAQLLVSAATDIAVELGVSELVIGLTVVAIGTSLPELATSMLAAYRGQRDLAVGNVIGSNLFNLLAVLGITATISPSSIPVPDGALTLDFPVMVAAAFACLPVFVNGFELRRWEGALFMCFYVVYVAYLVLDATDHDLSSTLGGAALIVGPLTLVTFSVVGWRAWRRDRTDAPATA